MGSEQAGIQMPLPRGPSTDLYLAGIRAHKS